MYLENFVKEAGWAATVLHKGKKVPYHIYEAMVRGNKDLLSRAGSKGGVMSHLAKKRKAYKKSNPPTSPVQTEFELKPKVTKPKEQLSLESFAKKKEKNAAFTIIYGALIKQAVASNLQQLIQAKQFSDNKDYTNKNRIIRKLVCAHPHKFKIDSQLNGRYVGITYLPTNFKIHVPRKLVPELEVK